MAPASEERRGVPAADERAEVKAPEATGANGGDPWPARAARADSRRQESTPQPPLQSAALAGHQGVAALPHVVVLNWLLGHSGNKPWKTVRTRASSGRRPSIP